MVGCRRSVHAGCVSGVTLLFPSSPIIFGRGLGLRPALLLLTASVASGVEPTPAVTAFRHDVLPVLENYCYDCHGDGHSKGKVAFDELTDADLTARPDLWFNALRNVRANIMPPVGKPRPSADEAQRVANWIKYSAFGLSAADPDPGRVTIRRLNRIEYGRTVRSLLGVDFPSEAEFPPDDTGHGFDNIGDVLSMSPLLLEKYLQAAETIVSGVVPQSARVTPVLTATGQDFRDFPASKVPEEKGGEDGGRPARDTEGRPLGYAETVTVTHVFTVPHDAKYQVAFDLAIKGPFNFDAARCRLVLRIDGQPCSDEALGWHDHAPIQLNRDVKWKAGPHEVSIAVTPLPPAERPKDAPGAGFDETQKLEVRIHSVQVKGPFDAAARVLPPDYRRFFPRGEPPLLPSRRTSYAREILADFASRAFRRPADDATVAGLVRLARSVETAPDGTFELGISRAMMAVLASPRFLFRLERTDPADTGARFPRLDEYSLATRLAYFLWSTMPDAELLAQAQQGGLRASLHAQVARLLRDPQALALVRNFTGQWLQARDVEFVPINARAVLGLPPQKRGDPRIDFDGDTRRAMRRETEMVFDRVVREDRSVLELVDSNYTYLNEGLAKVYGIPGVTGRAMRLVALPEGSPRGGVLTEGTVLTVTSNPTRTSPVKRGQFVLENILGTPTPPPPPNIPALEDAKNAFHGREPTLREMLATHRESKLCSSCHARMDPLGLAFENFNALGNWRDQEAGQPISPAGQLVTGEEFTDVRALKRLIAHERRGDYYRCLTEKLLTYALGRGLEYYDVETVDRIVAALERDGGRFSTLLFGVIDSAAFQRQRVVAPSGVAAAGSVPSAATPTQ